MKRVKGNIKASISLSKSTCYLAENGHCSLELVSDLFISNTVRTNADDLLFCPRLYKSMITAQAPALKDRNRPIVVTACECGHAEVVSGHQRACIASRKNLVIPINFIDRSITEKNCSHCGGQIKLYKEAGDSTLINLKICIESRVDDDVHAVQNKKAR